MGDNSETSTASSGPGTRLAGTLVRLMPFAAVAVGAMPLLSSSPAPLHDWPSHLARVWIIARVLDGEPFWMAHYVFQGFLLPNAILDVGVLGLLKLGLSLDHAGTVFLLLVYAIFIGGFSRLAIQSGGSSSLTLPFAAACFYTLPFFWGFLNFICGLSLMLWALAFWYSWQYASWRRAALAVTATVAIAFCHIVAAALFLGIAGCLDLTLLLQRRRAVLRTMLPSIAGTATAMLFLLASPVAANGQGPLRWRGGDSFAGLILGKLALFPKTILSFQLGPDVLAALACLLIGGVVVAKRPRIGLAWAVAVAAICAAALIAPEWINESGFLDARIPAVALVILAATTSFSRCGLRTSVVVCGLLVARSAWLAVDWQKSGEIYRTLDAALSELPAGSTLLAGLATPIAQVPLPLWWSPPISNAASLAVTHGVFVPSVFASGLQQPLVLRPEWATWAGYQDAATPQQLGAVLARAQRDCKPATNLFLLYPKQLPADVALRRLPEDLRSRVAMLNVC